MGHRRVGGGGGGGEIFEQENLTIPSRASFSPSAMRQPRWLQICLFFLPYRPRHASLSPRCSGFLESTWWLIKSPKTRIDRIAVCLLLIVETGHLLSLSLSSLAKFVAFVSSGVVAFFGSISILEGREETDKQIKARFLTTWEERFDDCIYIYIYFLLKIDRYRVLSLFCPVESSRMMPNWRRPRSPRNGPVQFRLPGRLGSVRDRPYTRYIRVIFFFFSQSSS